MPSIRRERLLRHIQTIGVVIAMAIVFGATGFVLLGGTGLAIVAGSALVLLIVVGRRELKIDTSQATLLSDAGHPELQSTIEDLASRAGVDPAPTGYLIQADEMNAATTGSESQPMLVITRPMLSTLDDRELRGILAHEVSHLAQHDLSFFRLVMTLQLMTMSVARVGWLMLLLFWPLLLAGGARIPPLAIALLLGAPVVSVLLQAALSRAREYAADLGALELTGDAEGLASALEKIDRRQRRLWRQVLPVPQQRRRRGSILRTHPAQEERVERLRELEPEVRERGDD